MFEDIYLVMLAYQFLSEGLGSAIVIFWSKELLHVGLAFSNRYFFSMDLHLIALHICMSRLQKVQGLLERQG